MKKIIKKYDQVGKYEESILFGKRGEEKVWVGIVDARSPGQYDLMVTAEHEVGETGGRITVRGVVGKGATLNVKGLIKIQKKAQKVDDFLEIRILLLDATARATAEPELEIEADNVRASHAASVGKVDEEQMLYLMSRGLSKEQSENQIITGFLQQS